MNRVKRLFGSPYAAMGIVLAMYVGKVCAKIAIGRAINSPAITGDGMHNASDIAEALLVMLVMAVSSRRAMHYPFGLKRVESVGETLIGASLIATAFVIAAKTALGILARFPSTAGIRATLSRLAEPELPATGGSAMTAAIAIMATSIAASFAASRYQITVGKRTGHPALVADGEETRGDGYVECIALAGLLGKRFLGISWLEYPLALLVAAFVGKTGVEILVRGVRSLLMRSIGYDAEQRISAAVGSIPGIAAVAPLKSFGVGGDAVCLMKAVTRAPAAAHDDLRDAAKRRAEAAAGEVGFSGCQLYLRFTAPDPNRHRVAYAIRKFGDAVAVAPSLEDVTHVRICDIEDGDVVRAKDVPFAAGDDIVPLLRKKHARMFISYELDPLTRAVLAAAGIEYRRSVTYAPPGSAA